MRTSPLAASSVGIDLNRTKVVVFALSAALAGLGGALYASLQQSITPVDFNYQFSLVFVVVVATTGVATVEGAIQAGMGFVVVQQLLSYLPGRAGGPSLAVVLFALAALGYAAHPEGVVEYQKRRATQWIERRLRARGWGDDPNHPLLEPAVAGADDGGPA
jgi:ABC-type branched-subunit amino acid transport system permease subunit